MSGVSQGPITHVKTSQIYSYRHWLQYNTANCLQNRIPNPNDVVPAQRQPIHRSRLKGNIYRISPVNIYLVSRHSEWKMVLQTRTDELDPSCQPSQPSIQTVFHTSITPIHCARFLIPG
jgi:hypothetical protein